MLTPQRFSHREKVAEGRMRVPLQLYRRNQASGRVTLTCPTDILSQWERSLIVSR